MSEERPRKKPRSLLELFQLWSSRDGRSPVSLMVEIYKLISADPSMSAFEEKLNLLLRLIKRTFAGSSYKSTVPVEHLERYREFVNAQLVRMKFPSFDELMEDFWEFYKDGYYNTALEGKFMYFNELISMLYPLVVLCMGKTFNPSIIPRGKGNLPLAAPAIAETLFRKFKYGAPVSPVFAWGSNADPAMVERVRQAGVEDFVSFSELQRLEEEDVRRRADQEANQRLMTEMLRQDGLSDFEIRRVVSSAFAQENAEHEARLANARAVWTKHAEPGEIVVSQRVGPYTDDRMYPAITAEQQRWAAALAPELVTKVRQLALQRMYGAGGVPFSSVFPFRLEAPGAFPISTPVGAVSPRESATGSAERSIRMSENWLSLEDPDPDAVARRRRFVFDHLYFRRANPIVIHTREPISGVEVVTIVFYDGVVFNFPL